MVVASEHGLDTLPRVEGEMVSPRLRLDPLPAASLATFLAAHGVAGETAGPAAEALSRAGLGSPVHAARLAAELAGTDAPSVGTLDKLLQGAGRRLWARLFWRLTPPEQRLVKLASFCTSGVNAWRGARLGGLDRAEIVAATLALEGAGWLRRAYPHGRLRFVLRDTVAAEAVIELCPPHERAELHEAIAALLAEDDLDADDTCAERGRHLAALGRRAEAAVAMCQAARFHLSSNRPEEARRHFEEALHLLQHEPMHVRERLAALEGLADLALREGSLEEQLQRYRYISQEAGAVLGDEDRARLQRKMARRLLDEGHLDRAMAALRSAEAEAGASELERALLEDTRAHLLVRQGDLAGAAECNRKALDAAVRLGDDRLLGRFYETLGYIGFIRGDMHLALSELERAADLFDAVGDASGYAQACLMQGNALSKMGRFAEATPKYRRALRVREAIGDVYGATSALYNLASMQVRADDLDGAEATLQECRRAWRRLQSPAGEASCLANLASIATQRGQYDTALHMLLQAAAFCEKAGDVPLLLATRNATIAALLSLGRLGAAMAQAEELRRLAEARGVAVQRVHALCSLGACRHHVGDVAGAREATAEALRQAREHGLEVEVWDGLNQLVDVELQAGNLAAAREHLDEASAHVTHPFQQREMEIQRLTIDLEARGGRGFSPTELAVLASLAAGGSDLAARAHLLMARGLDGHDAYGHACLAYEALAPRGDRESFWRAASRRAELEAELKLPGAAGHLEEASRTVLASAVDLSPQHRLSYLESFGRGELLQRALGSRL